MDTCSGWPGWVAAQPAFLDCLQRRSAAQRQAARSDAVARGSCQHVFVHLEADDLRHRPQDGYDPSNSPDTLCAGCHCSICGQQGGGAPTTQRKGSDARGRHITSYVATFQSTDHCRISPRHVDELCPLSISSAVTTANHVCTEGPAVAVSAGLPRQRAERTANCPRRHVP